MGSFLRGATGTGNSFAAQGAPIQGQDFTGGLKTAGGQFGQAFGNETNLGNILMNELGGNGPSPEQLETQQMNENAIKSNAGMIASQRGISPALAQRMAAMSGGQMQQQAAGQGAMMGMNRSLAVQQALGGLYGNQANQAAGQQSTLQNALAAYNNANVGMTANQNNVNAGVAAQNAQTAGGLVGGIASGASGAISSLFAKGGEVKDPGLYKENPKTKMVPDPQRFEMGGPVQNWGYGMQPNIGSGAGMANAYINGGGQALANGISSLLNPMMSGGTGSKEQTDDEAQEGYLDSNAELGIGGIDNVEKAMPASGGDMGMMSAATGGEVPPHFHHMAMIYHPDFGGKMKELKAKGGNVPGQAKVSGNSYKNDTVPAMLSPGEIVLPRSVTQSQNPVKAAADFVAEKLREKQGKDSDHSSDFHDALKRAIGSRRSK